jgi:hypothetical protein
LGTPEKGQRISQKIKVFGDPEKKGKQTKNDVKGNLAEFFFLSKSR